MLIWDFIFLQVLFTDTASTIFFISKSCQWCLMAIFSSRTIIISSRTCYHCYLVDPTRLSGRLEEGIFLLQSSQPAPASQYGSLPHLPGLFSDAQIGSDWPPNHQLPPSLCDLLCCSGSGGFVRLSESQVTSEGPGRNCVSMMWLSERHRVTH